MSAQTPRRRKNLKRPRDIVNSSDTDYTPPRKRSRAGHAHSPKREHDCDLEQLLRRCLSDPSDHAAIEELKGMKIGDQNTLYAVQKIIDNAKASVRESVEKEGQAILEVELYLEWLKGLDFVLVALEAGLQAKIPGTRRRVPGLGRIAFSILYHLLDEFITEVNAHQDGWSHRYPAGPVEPNPLIMSLAEEANDPATDGRSEDAIRDAEDILARYDCLMALSVRRYKSECNKKLMADGIGRREDSLAKACCLLSEQTGYGGTDDIGFTLLTKTREAMAEWKSEFGDRGGYDTDG